MRFALRLPSLALALAAAPVLADDRKPENWALCPVADVIPAFAGAPATSSDPAKARAERADLETRIDADSQTSDGVQSSYDGNVVLVRGDQYLRADDLQANQDEGSYVATRGVRYQDSGMRIVADRVQGNMYTENHQLDNVRYQLVDRRGNGGAERIVMGGANGQLLHATYSACDPSAQHWELKARSIDVDTDTGWGVARGASVRIGKVPVLYVPWIKFPVDEQRHTGLLYPSVSLSGRNGFDWRQPIYLNLAPNYDATLTPRWMSDRGLQLGAQGRWLYENGRGTVDAAWMQSDELVERRIDDVASGSYNPLNDPLRSTDRGMLRFNGSHDLNSVWQARAQGQWVSDSRYLEDMGSSGNGGIAQAAISSSVGLYGNSRFWNAGIMADTWQNSDYRYDDSILAYNRLPRAWFDWERPFGRWLVPGLKAEVAHFQHNTRGDGSRLDLKPSLSLPLQGASWYLTPSVAWRHTAYDLEPELADDIARRRAAAAQGIAESAVTPGMLASYRNDSPSRSLPITSLDAGLFFDRDTDIKGDRYLHTLEPRLFYLRVPYHDQNDQPIFDSRALTFSWGQLFRDNRYSGADRQSDANQLTLALSTRLLRQRDGHERLSLSFGQIRYFEDSRVAVLANEVPIEQGKSAWVADASYAPTDRWTIGTSYQWNPKYRREDLASLRARYLFPDDGVINLTYRYRRNLGDGSDLLKQADFSFLYPVNPNWSIVGRYYYSLLDDQILEALGGVQWDSCCLAVRVLARRYVRSREGEMNNSLGFEFELKGLGSAGRGTDRTLRRAILGYHRDDLYLAPPSNAGFDPDDNDSSLDGLP